ncbi:hypothetical protein EV126DRAFT_432710 [Verticillium dahliae]|nr:hypothetical protein EV126DRAFT_432710 [Verticillium dahliae]
MVRRLMTAANAPRWGRVWIVGHTWTSLGDAVARSPPSSLLDLRKNQMATRDRAPGTTHLSRAGARGEGRGVRERSHRVCAYEVCHGAQSADQRKGNLTDLGESGSLFWRRGRTGIGKPTYIFPPGRKAGKHGKADRAGGANVCMCVRVTRCVTVPAPAPERPILAPWSLTELVHRP